jgi:serine/threonine protein kinase
VLCAPSDVIVERDVVGHYAPFAEGSPLEEYLKNPNSTFVEGLQLAIVLAHAVGVLHARGIAHGDLQADNLIVSRLGSVFRLYVIDIDNFNAVGMPAPPCIGHNLYMAPELRQAAATSHPAVPTILTDRYSLGVLMHEIILLCHVCAGNDATEADFQRAMTSGRWVQDPAAADRPAHGGGYPAEVLNADLGRLFRLAQSLNPLERPSAVHWEAELAKAFTAVYSCTACGGPCVIDVSKTSCPLCGGAFPHLTMHISGGSRSLPLSDGSTLIGRNDLGGSFKVSARHVIVRRIGPETWLESVGSNGTFRRSQSHWMRLPDKKSVLVQSGDCLRLGDIEVRLS